MGLAARRPEELLPLVYAAVTDEREWKPFCEALNKLIDVPAILFSHDIVSHKSLGMLGSGWDPAQLERYDKYYGHHNPWMAMNNAMPIGYVGQTDYAISRQKLFKTEFYNEWLRPQENLVVGAATICYRKNGRFLALSATCPEKRHENTLPEAIRALKILGPHVTRAIEMSSVLMNGCDNTRASLNLSRHAIITIRRNGDVGAVNRAAEHMMRKTGAISLASGDKLTAKDDEARRFIADAIKSMKNQDFGSPLQPFPLRDPGRGDFLLHAHVFPEASQLEFPQMIWDNVVIGCFVVSGPCGLEDVDIASMLMSAFGATHAEACLGQALMCGQSLYDYAETKSLSRHTVRNQMRVLLAKTDSRNQMKFIQKLAGLISPFGTN